jgi:GNAT superfamily N-acetyltransferase
VNKKRKTTGFLSENEYYGSNRETFVNPPLVNELLSFIQNGSEREKKLASLNLRARIVSKIEINDEKMKHHQAPENNVGNGFDTFSNPLESVVSAQLITRDNLTSMNVPVAETMKSIPCQGLETNGTLKNYTAPVANILLQHCVENLVQRTAKDIVQGSQPLLSIHDSEILSSIVFPSLFYRGVFIRPIMKHEFETLRSMYLTDMNEIKILNILTKGNISGAKKIHHLVFAESPSAKKVLGYIHFDIRKQSSDDESSDDEISDAIESSKMCYVKSIQVIEKFRQGKGIGTLLMGYALKVALKTNCIFMELISVQKSLPFYISLGFKPQCNEISTFASLICDAPQKNQDCSVYDAQPLELDLQNSQSLKVFNDRLEKALDPRSYVVALNTETSACSAG